MSPILGTLALGVLVHKVKVDATWFFEPDVDPTACEPTYL